METTLAVTADDGSALAVRRWTTVAGPRAVVQIAHGMAEHSGRYGHVAELLVAGGYEVWASDHRGHGRTATSAAERGHLADQDGWERAVTDLRAVSHAIRIAHPDAPLVLFGHSMGSTLARSYATAHGNELAGLALSGVSGPPGLSGRAGHAIAAVEARLRGARHRSTLMNALTFGRFNHGFRPARTRFDWLSRDPDVVDAYIADAECGFLATSAFFRDLLGGVLAVNDPANVARIPPSLPILVLAGAMDPVGANGVGARRVAAALRDAGVTDVTLKIYDGARHEVVNETNRAEVIGDLVRWLDAHLGG